MGSCKVIENGLIGKLFVNNHCLDEYFVCRKLLHRREDPTTKKEGNFEQVSIVCKDLPGLIDQIFYINDPFPNVKSNLAKRFTESGVKILFILGISPKVPEHYVNVKRLWINSDIDSLRRNYTVATDLKLCNIMLGMMSHSSLYPCCWCDIAKNNLKYKGNQA